jgi:hypothetical protein
MLHPASVVMSWMGAVNAVPPGGRPVPVIVPDSITTPSTTEVVRLLSAPVKTTPPGRVPVTGSVVGAGCAAATRLVTAGLALAAMAPGPKLTAPASTMAVPYR